MVTRLTGIHSVIAIATDLPGFETDENLESLGENLQLPAQYEADRVRIEAHLPLIKVLSREVV